MNANTVDPNPDGAGAWYSGVSPNENSSDAFWDNASKDGSQCNVGYWLSGESWSNLASRCANDGGVVAPGGSGPGNLSFFGSATSPSRPVGWDMTSSGDQTLQMTVEVAGYRGTNVLGYYTVDSNGVRSFNTGTVIYNGSDGAGATETITIPPGTTFGFFVCSNAGSFAGCNASNIMFSGSEYSPQFLGLTTPTAGKFALFSENPTNPNGSSSISKYWVGVEDTAGLDATEHWGDYNDMIFSATVVPVNTPEPLTSWIYGADMVGLLGICFIFTRRTRRASEV